MEKNRITTRRVKIAFLNIYNGVIDRGAETFVKEVASRLSRKNEVVVFQAGENKSVYKYGVEQIPVNWDWGNKSGVGTIRARLFMDYWNGQVAYFTLKAIPKLLKERFDVVIPVNGGWQPAIVRFITWIYGGKMVISGQAGMGWDERNNLWCFPDNFVAISSFAKKWARRVNPFTKISYIPNGVDVSKFKSRGEKFKTDLINPIVLSVGALTSAKRMDLVIKAASKLKNVSLLMIGDGDLRDELRNLGNKLLKNRFQLDKVSFEKMPEVYRSADLFTIPSAPHHSFEIVLVEAMATGLPVVANNDPIRKEIVGDAGILVDPTDTDAYADSLEKALKTNWGEEPRKQAEKFDWDKIAGQYEQLFLSLCK